MFKLHRKPEVRFQLVKQVPRALCLKMISVTICRFRLHCYESYVEMPGVHKHRLSANKRCSKTYLNWIQEFVRERQLVL